METSFFEGLVFPWMSFSAAQIIASGKGSLFRFDEKMDPDVELFRQMRAGQWAKCRNGYAAFAFDVRRVNDQIVVLHGLKVAGVSTVQGRAASLSIKLDREHVEHYVDTFKAGVDALDDSYKTLIRENIHEIRGINSSLYNAAYELQERLDAYGRSDLLSIGKNVVALSQILTGRIDYMDFIANPATEAVRKSDIPVYKKFDKVQKCFRVSAAAKKVTINFSGSGSRTIHGPPIFDLIPYLLIENAVKYAPEGSSIEVVCNESPDAIHCEVRSVGPKVLEEEKPHIFTGGVRGKIAVRTGRSGAGLGLSVLKRLVESVFSGSIKFSQYGERPGPNNLPYCNTSFEVAFRIR